MSPSSITIPVTAALRQALVSTEEKLTAWETHRVTDRSHFAQVAEQLDALTVAVLAAPGAWSPLKLVVSVSACIDMGPRSALTAFAAECADYLSGPAKNLLRDGGSALSTYHVDHAATATAKLKALYGIVLDSIRRQAEKDLRKIVQAGAAPLLRVANQLAYGAASELYASEAMDVAEPESEENPDGF